MRYTVRKELSWESVQRAADKDVPKYTRAFITGVSQSRDAVSWEEVTRAIEAHDERRAESALGYLFPVLTSTLRASFEKLLFKTLAAGGEAEAKFARNKGFRTADVGSPIGALRFDKTNPLATEWAKTRSSTLITNVTNETRAAIRSIIHQSFAQGTTVADAARSIRPLIGLTERSADAVAKLRKAMLDNPGAKIWAGKTAIRVPKGGADFALINKRAEQYANRLISQRATMIARTETIAAANEGQRELWKQAIGKGLLDKEIRREWFVTPDERACEECVDSNGDVTLVDEPFPNGSWGPPLHPSCRCAQGVTTRPLTNPRTPTVTPTSTLPVLNTGPMAAADLTNLTVNGVTNAGEQAFIEQAKRVGFYEENLQVLREGLAVQQDVFAGLGKLESDAYFSQGRLRISTRIVDGVTVDGNAIKGVIIRQFEMGRDGLTVVHHEFAISDVLHGQGRARRMMALSMDSYLRGEVQYVYAGCNIDVGGYAWAKLGFQSRNRAEFFSMMKSRVATVMYAPEGGPLAPISLERQKELINGVYQRSVGQLNTAPSWLASQPEGRAILLNSEWSGVMDLTSKIGRQTASELAGMI